MQPYYARRKRPPEGDLEIKNKLNSRPKYLFQEKMKRGEALLLHPFSSFLRHCFVRRCSSFQYILKRAYDVANVPNTFTHHNPAPQAGRSAYWPVSFGYLRQAKSKVSSPRRHVSSPGPPRHGRGWLAGIGSRCMDLVTRPGALVCGLIARQTNIEKALKPIQVILFFAQVIYFLVGVISY